MRDAGFGERSISLEQSSSYDLNESTEGDRVPMYKYIPMSIEKRVELNRPNYILSSPLNYIVITRQDHRLFLGQSAADEAVVSLIVPGYGERVTTSVPFTFNNREMYREQKKWARRQCDARKKPQARRSIRSEGQIPGAPESLRGRFAIGEPRRCYVLSGETYPPPF